jgi:hypothetical protein
MFQHYGYGNGYGHDNHGGHHGGDYGHHREHIKPLGYYYCKKV